MAILCIGHVSRKVAQAGMWTTHQATEGKYNELLNHEQLYLV